MKNTIWVGKNKFGKQFTCTEKMTLGADGYFYKNDKDTWEPNVDEEFDCDNTDFFGLNLKNGEIVQVIIDTETQSYEVKRPREIGWYLTVDHSETATARHWNGKDWYGKKRDARSITYTDGELEVISEKLPPNEYLKSLE